MNVIYGINPVAEALKGSAEGVERVIVSSQRRDKVAEGLVREAEERGVPVERVSPREIERLSGTDRHQGVAAVLRGEFSYSDLDGLISAWKRSIEPAFFLVLDSIQDPQNLGALVRSASAAGVHGIIVPKDRACMVTPAVVKASAGATAHMAIARETNLVRAIATLKEAGVWTVAVEADCPENIYGVDLKTDIAIVIGSEGKGIRRLVRSECDLCARIPMTGKLNSLNAAQAGTIAIFEVRRQRLGGTFL